MSFMSRLRNFWQSFMNGFNSVINFFKNIFGVQQSSDPDLNNTTNNNIPIIIKNNEQDITETNELRNDRNIANTHDLDSEDDLIMDSVEEYDMQPSSSLFKPSRLDQANATVHKITQHFKGNTTTDTEILFDEAEYTDDTASFMTAPDKSDDTSSFMSAPDGSDDTASFMTAPDESDDTPSFKPTSTKIISHEDISNATSSSKSTKDRKADLS